MKKLLNVVLVLLAISVMIPVKSDAASYAVTTIDNLYTTLLAASVNSPPNGSYSNVYNGKTVTIDNNVTGAGGDVYVDGLLLGRVLGPSDGGTANQPSMLLLAQALGISMTTSGSIASPNSPTTATTRVVFDSLVLPSSQTTSEKKKEDAKKRQHAVRVFSSNVNTEWVRNGGEEGNVYGFNIGLAYDFDKFTIGAVVPYDRLDNNIYTGDRVGTVLFGQYHIMQTETTRLSATVNTNYIYSGFNFNNSSLSQSVNVFGTGVSLGGQYKISKVDLGAGVTYQYNADDSGLADTDQHLVKLGSKVGYHITGNQILSALGYYTEDVTSYKLNYGKQNYFEVGGEYKMNITDDWTMNLGYKKTLGVPNYRSDYVTLGAMWMF